MYFFFLKILQLDKFEGAAFKYDNVVLKVQPKTFEIKHIWSQIKLFLFFHEILQFE